MIYDLLINVNGSINHSPGPRSGSSLSALASDSEEALLFGGMSRVTSGEQCTPLTVVRHDVLSCEMKGICLYNQLVSACLPPVVVVVWKHSFMDCGGGPCYLRHCGLTAAAE